MATIKYKWQPGVGDAVEVNLFKVNSSLYDVGSTKQTMLGAVFNHPVYGWRWRRDGVNEQRGSRLTTRDCAVSALLFALRQEGKV